MYISLECCEHKESFIYLHHTDMCCHIAVPSVPAFVHMFHFFACWALQKIKRQAPHLEKPVFAYNKGADELCICEGYSASLLLAASTKTANNNGTEFQLAF